MKESFDPTYVYAETFSAEAPRVSPEIYRVLSDHLTQDGADKSESHNALNDVYKALAASEREVDTALHGLEQAGLINKEEVLALAVLFIAAKTLGPDLTFVSQALTARDFDVHEMNARIAGAGLDRSIVDCLQPLMAKLALQESPEAGL